MAPKARPQRRQRSLFTYVALTVLTAAIVYRDILSNAWFVLFGVGRDFQAIEEFPWTCTRLQHPLLEGCEDMWLDHQDRKVYGACTSVDSRKGWSPGGDKYDLSARSRTDHITVLDIDHPGSDGLYGVRQLKISGYKGDLDLHGFDVHEVGDTLRFWLINHRPPVDQVTGEFLDATKLGANSTIEIFDLNRASETLEYVKTIASEAIITPNNLAVDDDGVGALISNDHATKVGSFRVLEMLYGTGSLTYCRFDTGKCHIAGRKGFAMPNGVVKDRNGFFYVSHSVTGLVTIHRLTKDGQLELVDTISLGYPLDNMSLDEEGSLFVAGFPDVIKFTMAMENPHELVAPAVVMSINDVVGQLERGEKHYNVSKVVEDKDAKFLPTSTVALHDVKSRRLFIGGVISPFITICEGNDS